MRKHFLIVICFGLLTCALTGCESTSPSSPTNSDPLIGTWNWLSTITSSPSGYSDTLQPSTLYTYQYVFGSGGSLSIPYTVFGYPVTYTGSWSKTTDSMTITTNDTSGSSSSNTWAYVISGSSLTLTRGQVSGSATNTIVEKYAKQ